MPHKPFSDDGSHLPRPGVERFRNSKFLKMGNPQKWMVYRWLMFDPFASAGGWPGRRGVTNIGWFPGSPMTWETPPYGTPRWNRCGSLENVLMIYELQNRWLAVGDWVYLESYSLVDVKMACLTLHSDPMSDWWGSNDVAGSVSWISVHGYSLLALYLQFTVIHDSGNSHIQLTG